MSTGSSDDLTEPTPSPPVKPIKKKGSESGSDLSELPSEEEVTKSGAADDDEEETKERAQGDNDEEDEDEENKDDESDQDEEEEGRYSNRRRVGHRGTGRRGGRAGRGMIPEPMWGWAKTKPLKNHSDDSDEDDSDEEEHKGNLDVNGVHTTLQPQEEELVNGAEEDLDMHDAHDDEEQEAEEHDEAEEDKLAEFHDEQAEEEAEVETSIKHDIQKPASEHEHSHEEDEEPEEDAEDDVELQPADRPDALEALAKLELRFALLRQRIYTSKMEELSKEEDLLRQGWHPELTYTFRELDLRKARRISLAKIKRKKDIELAKKTRTEEEDAVWSWWTMQRDALQSRLISESSSKRRRVERERRALLDPLRRNLGMEQPHFDWDRYHHQQRRGERETTKIPSIKTILSVSLRHPYSRMGRGKGGPKAPSLSQLDDLEIQDDLDIFSAHRRGAPPPVPAVQPVTTTIPTTNGYANQPTSHPPIGNAGRIGYDGPSFSDHLAAHQHQQFQTHPQQQQQQQPPPQMQHSYPKEKDRREKERPKKPTSSSHHHQQQQQQQPPPPPQHYIQQPHQHHPSLSGGMEPYGGSGLGLQGMHAQPPPPVQRARMDERERDLPHLPPVPNTSSHGSWAASSSKQPSYGGWEGGRDRSLSASGRNPQPNYPPQNQQPPPSRHHVNSHHIHHQSSGSSHGHAGHNHPQSGYAWKEEVPGVRPGYPERERERERDRERVQPVMHPSLTGAGSASGGSYTHTQNTWEKERERDRGGASLSSLSAHPSRGYHQQGNVESSRTPRLSYPPGNGPSYSPGYAEPRDRPQTPHQQPRRGSPSPQQRHVRTPPPRHVRSPPPPLLPPVPATTSRYAMDTSVDIGRPSSSSYSANGPTLSPVTSLKSAPSSSTLSRIPASSSLQKMLVQDDRDRVSSSTSGGGKPEPGL